MINVSLAASRQKVLEEELPETAHEAWSLAPAREQIADLADTFARMLPLVAIGFVVLAVAVALSGFIGRVAEKVLTGRVENQIIRASVRRALVLATVVLGVYLALQISGLTKLATTILGGTSLIGIAFGFAFRDIAENFLSGVLLSVRRPFAIGDTIEVGGHTGVVRAVTAHGTKLIDFDGNVIQLSNSTVYKGTVRNFTSNPKTREQFSVGIGYDYSIEDAQAIVLDVLESHEAVLDDPEPSVMVTKLGSSVVELEAHAWLDSTKYSRIKVRSILIRSALRRLREEGVSMPDDAREVVFPNAIPVRMLEGEEARKDAEAIERAKEPPVQLRAGEGDAEGSLESETAELAAQADEANVVEENEALVER